MGKYDDRFIVNIDTPAYQKSPVYYKTGKPFIIISKQNKGKSSFLQQINESTIQIMTEMVRTHVYTITKPRLTT